MLYIMCMCVCVCMYVHMLYIMCMCVYKHRWPCPPFFAICKWPLYGCYHNYILVYISHISYAPSHMIVHTTAFVTLPERRNRSMVYQEASIWWPSANALSLIYILLERIHWCMHVWMIEGLFSCLWDSAYKRSLAANRKEWSMTSSLSLSLSEWSFTIRP